MQILEQFSYRVYAISTQIPYFLGLFSDFDFTSSIAFFMAYSANIEQCILTGGSLR